MDSDKNTTKQPAYEIHRGYDEEFYSNGDCGTEHHDLDDNFNFD